MVTKWEKRSNGRPNEKNQNESNRDSGREMRGRGQWERMEGRWNVRGKATKKKGETAVAIIYLENIFIMYFQFANLSSRPLFMAMRAPCTVHVSMCMYFHLNSIAKLKSHSYTWWIVHSSKPSKSCGYSIWICQRQFLVAGVFRCGIIVYSPGLGLAFLFTFYFYSSFLLLLFHHIYCVAVARNYRWAIQMSVINLIPFIIFFFLVAITVVLWKWNAEEETKKS